MTRDPNAMAQMAQGDPAAWSAATRPAIASFLDQDGVIALDKGAHWVGRRAADDVARQVAGV